MKTALVAMMLSFSVLALGSVPVEKKVPVDHIYVPYGFDSNDTTEVILTGFLPNLCHKAPSAKVTVNGNKVDIVVTSLFYDASNPFCPDMIVPFTETVSLGVMDKGNYEITVNGKTPWEKKELVKISESTSNSVDEHHYAYVNYIDKETNVDGTVTLKGYNPSDCFELDSIEHVDNRKDTYSVLPKLKQVREFCPMKMVPFSYEWKVPTKLKQEKVLLHVRTMNGESVNTIYNTKK